MPRQVHQLSDVQPGVLALCKQGANRQRIFLKKSMEKESTFELPGGQRLLRKAEGSEWSYFYCVVAEPDALEDPGVGDGAGSGVEDVWASEDEIRKAAHHFAKSPALVTGMHDTVEPFGQVVENAIALQDFKVLAPTGEEQVIKKGSWYVGIEPTDEGKRAIDAGEFTGISLEGTGSRTLVTLEKESGEERTLKQRVAELFGLRLPKDAGTLHHTDQEDEDEDVADEKLTAEVEELKKSQSATTTAIEGLTQTVNRLLSHVEKMGKTEEKKDPETETDAEKIQKSVSTLQKSFEEFAGKLDSIESDVDKLADAGSKQDRGSDTIKKQTSGHALAGLLD